MNSNRDMKIYKEEKPKDLSESLTEFSVGLNIDTREKTGVHPRIFRMMVSYLGSVGSVMCFVSAVIPSKVSLAVIAFSALIPTLLCVLASFSKKREKLILLASYVLTAFFIFRIRDDLTVGFKRTFNIFYDEIKIKYIGWSHYDISSYSRVETEHGIVMLFVSLALVISLVAGTFMICRTSVISVFAAIFPLFELVLYYGLVPNYFYAAFVIAALVFSVTAEISEFPVTGKSRRLPVYAKTSAEAAFLGAVIFLFCFYSADRYVSVSNFERTEKMNDFRVHFSTYMKSFSFKKFAKDLAASMPSDSTADGAINHGKLGRSDSIEFTDRTMLTVTLPKTGDNIYLKGFIGVNYTGSSWEELSGDEKTAQSKLTSQFETPFLSPQFLDGYSVERYIEKTGEKFDTLNFSVVNNGANRDFGYIPYALTPDCAAGVDVTSDKVTPKKEAYYSAYRISPTKKFRFLTANNFSSLIPDSDEEKYRKFVYDNFLDIPETFTAPKYIYMNAERKSLDSELLSLRNYLGENCEYSLEAGKTPFGYDFAQYFITENKKGSCSHFATTAALMCRYRGIPSRYIEGYVIKPEDFPENVEYGESAAIEVTDERAHAWIEVYLDGYGWIPFEVTPGYTESFEYYTELPQGGAENVPQESIIALPEPVTETSAVITEETETETNAGKETEAVNTESESASVSEEETGAEDKKPDVPASENKSFDPLPLIIVFTAVLTVFLFFLMRYMRISDSRDKRLKGKNSRQKSYAAGKYFLKLCAYKKIVKTKDESYEEFSVRAGEMLRAENAHIILAAALKSKFGKSAPEAEEAENAARKVISIADSIYGGLDRKNKFLFKYFYCLK